MQAIIDAKKLRKVAGAFATGVAVVTVEKPDRTIQGMTINSFLSVSLDPPLVLFSVQIGASISEHLTKGQFIGISILTEEQKELSDQFAGRAQQDNEVNFVKKEKVHIIDKALAWYATSIREIIPAGDHWLILCEVLALERAPNGQPLLYYSGYHSIGDKVNPLI